MCVLQAHTVQTTTEEQIRQLSQQIPLKNAVRSPHMTFSFVDPGSVLPANAYIRLHQICLHNVLALV